MTPASLLPVAPGDRVLDLCAAPGGKSTELAARLRGQGLLVANDISNSRAKALLKNLELAGVKNALVISENPSRLSEYFTGYFDKILVDAPCSGEGMFRKSPAIMKNWEQYGTGYYHKLQSEILPEAINMLKPGGYLLYSTCTFSPEENEGSIQEVLQQFPEIQLISALPEAAGTPDYTGFDCGHPEWVEGGSPELIKTVRLWPQRIEGEGHFIALLKKQEKDNALNLDENDDIDERNGHSNRKGNRQSGRQESGSSRKIVISEETEAFFDTIQISIPRERIYRMEDRLYLLPECEINTKGLRILRSGLLLGEEKKNRFEPSQALACALKAEEYDNTYCLTAEDPDVIRYLKCESIEIKKDCMDGWILVCVDGFPLGWGKSNNGSFKNKYLPGWRMM